MVVALTKFEVKCGLCFRGFTCNEQEGSHKMSHRYLHSGSVLIRDIIVKICRKYRFQKACTLEVTDHTL